MALNVVIYATQWGAEQDGIVSPIMVDNWIAFVDITGQQTLVPDPNTVVVAIICDDATMAGLNPAGIIMTQVFDEELYGGDYSAQIQQMIED